MPSDRELFKFYRYNDSSEKTDFLTLLWLLFNHKGGNNFGTKGAFKPSVSKCTFPPNFGQMASKAGNTAVRMSPRHFKIGLVCAKKITCLASAPMAVKRWELLRRMLLLFKGGTHLWLANGGDTSLTLRMWELTFGHRKLVVQLWPAHGGNAPFTVKCENI